MTRLVHTLVLVRDVPEKKLLLGYKKRGFGLNRWGLIGGKVEPFETIEEGAKREANEESGLIITEMKKIGHIDFEFEHKIGQILECHIFCADGFEGESQETEEILPKWFGYDDIPFDKMWKDAQLWLPKAFTDRNFNAYFLYGKDLNTIIDYRIEEFDCSCF